MAIYAQLKNLIAELENASEKVHPGFLEIKCSTLVIYETEGNESRWSQRCLIRCKSL